MDWRIDSAKHARGEILTFKKYTRWSDSWDHDHCEACWKKFMESGEGNSLTEGYARALALEAERWGIERKIADVAARLGDEVTDEDASELAQLGKRLSSADGDLVKLRALLVALRTRADEVRTAA